MADHIDRKDVVEYLRNSPLIPQNAKGAVVLDVEAIPAADVVEVVRCGECANADRSEAPALWCVGRGWPMQMVPLDGFCDKGKRKEDAP